MADVVSSADQVAAFMTLVKSDPDLAALGAVADPYLMLMSDKSGVVVMLDRLAELWAQARGGRFEIEVAA